MTAPPLDPTGADRRLRVVYCAVPDRARAEELARSAVEGRLAACANFWPIRSRYWWKGRIESSDEHALLFKTSAKKVGELFEHLASRHPYEVPDIHEIQVSRVHEPFVRWLFGSIDPGSAEPPVPPTRKGSRRAPAAPSRRRTRAPRRRR